MDKSKLSKMVMSLFSLKGKTGYNEIDVDAWVKYLHKYSEKDISRAFNACIQKPGFFEIKMVLDELQPNNTEIAINEWAKCVQVAKDGGAGFEKLSEPTKRALKAAGGLRQLRFTESEYTKNNMRKIFIETFDTTKIKIGFDKEEAVSLLYEANRRREITNQ